MCTCGCGQRPSKSRYAYVRGHSPFCRRGHDKRIVGVSYDGSTCRACKSIWDHDNHIRHKEARNANGRAWRVAHREQIATADRLWRYGLTDDVYQELQRKQGGLCAICRVGLAKHVDHNHTTGAVRGLLCNRCNLGLGMFDDHPEQLLSAARYVGAS